jgi:hypothetical protein
MSDPTVKPPSERIFTRNGSPRLYADFRDFRDVGGGQEAMIPEGQTRATTDRAVAETIASKRLEALKKRRALRTDTKLDRVASITEYAAEHLLKRAESNKVTDGWLAQTQKYLTEAAEYFGAGRLLHTIELEDVEQWVTQLRRTGLADGSIHHRLSALSNLLCDGSLVHRKAEKRRRSFSNRIMPR